METSVAEDSSAIADKQICDTERRLKRYGLGVAYRYGKLKELCEATKQISCIKGKDADGGTVDWVEVPDNAVQLNAIKEVFSLSGERKPIKADVNLGGNIMATVSKILSEAGNEHRD